MEISMPQAEWDLGNLKGVFRFAHLSKWTILWARKVAKYPPPWYFEFIFTRVWPRKRWFETRVLILSVVRASKSKCERPRALYRGLKISRKTGENIPRSPSLKGCGSLIFCFERVPSPTTIFSATLKERERCSKGFETVNFGLLRYCVIHSATPTHSWEALLPYLASSTAEKGTLWTSVMIKLTTGSKPFEHFSRCNRPFKEGLRGKNSWWS